MSQDPQAQAQAPEAARDSAAHAGRTARRSLLAFSGLAGAGLAGLFTASPAQATSGDALKAGRIVDAGTAGSGLRTRSAKVGFTVAQNGAGTAFSVRARGAGNGARAEVAARNRIAVIATNNASATDATGFGAAVLASGQHNVGLRATTAATAPSVPAVVATGAGGRGIALLATGSTLLDGDVLALRSLVGVLDVQDDLAYVHASTGDHATHSRHGVVQLSAAGAATVSLGARFLKAVSIQTLAVQLTPVGVSMPGLHYTATASGFTIGGGAASKRVSWVAFADRLVLTLGGASAAALTSAEPAPSSLVATGGSASAEASSAGVKARRGAVRPRPSGVLD